MKPYSLLICFSTLFYYSSTAQNNDIDVLKKLNNNWLNAYPKRDTAALSKILADDFMLITPNGMKQNKRDNLTNVLDPGVETLTVSFDSVQVKMLSPTIAMLNAWTNFTFKTDDKKIFARNCYQDIYVKRNGKWVAVAAHVTSLSMHE